MYGRELFVLAEDAFSGLLFIKGLLTPVYYDVNDQS